MHTVNKRPLRAPFGLLAAALLAVGCGAADAPESAPVPKPESADAAIPNLLTSLRLADGTQVAFHEPEAGRILVVSSGALPQAEGRLSAAALYERLAGQPAPAVLTQADERAALARAARAAAPTVAPIVPPLTDAQPAPTGVGQRQSALSATDFQAAYCPTGVYNFYYCWTNRTGDGSVEITSVDWLRTYVNPYRGQVNLKLSYKNLWGNWITLASITAPEDTVKTIYTPDNDTYKVEVTQAAGDGYHWSTYGMK